MRVASLPFNPSSALHNSTEKLIFHRRISDRGSKEMKEEYGKEGTIEKEATLPGSELR